MNTSGVSNHASGSSMSIARILIASVTFLTARPVKRGSACLIMCR